MTIAYIVNQKMTQCGLNVSGEGQRVGLSTGLELAREGLASTRPNYHVLYARRLI